MVARALLCGCFGEHKSGWMLSCFNTCYMAAKVLWVVARAC